MSDETKSNIAGAASNLWQFRIAAVWFFLFSSVSLGTAIMAALTGATWNLLDGQSKFMICLAVFVNWGGQMMAFISKQAKKIESGEIPDEPSTPTKTP